MNELETKIIQHDEQIKTLFNKTSTSTLFYRLSRRIRYNI